MLTCNRQDPLLFNRLGATYANAGQTELAIQYYLEAVELRPGYVRARFNLAVANMNMQQYDMAAEHLLGALAIQEEQAATHGLEGQANAGGRGAGQAGQSLWDSLNTCLLM